MITDFIEEMGYTFHAEGLQSQEKKEKPVENVKNQQEVSLLLLFELHPYTHKSFYSLASVWRVHVNSNDSLVLLAKKYRAYYCSTYHDFSQIDRSLPVVSSFFHLRGVKRERNVNHFF